MASTSWISFNTKDTAETYLKENGWKHVKDAPVGSTWKRGLDRTAEVVVRNKRDTRIYFYNSGYSPFG